MTLECLSLRSQIKHSSSFHLSTAYIFSIEYAMTVPYSRGMLCYLTSTKNLKEGDWNYRKRKLLLITTIMILYIHLEKSLLERSKIHPSDTYPTLWWISICVYIKNTLMNLLNINIWQINFVMKITIHYFSINKLIGSN